MRTNGIQCEAIVYHDICFDKLYNLCSSPFTICCNPLALCVRLPPMPSFPVCSLKEIQPVCGLLCGHSMFAFVTPPTESPHCSMIRRVHVILHCLTTTLILSDLISFLLFDSLAFGMCHLLSLLRPFESAPSPPESAKGYLWGRRTLSEHDAPFFPLFTPLILFPLPLSCTTSRIFVDLYLWLSVSSLIGVAARGMTVFRIVKNRSIWLLSLR